MKRTIPISKIAATAFFACGLSLHAQNFVEWSGGNGDFFNPTQWTGGAIPGTASIAVINNGSTATIADAANPRTIAGLQIGNVQGGTESGHVVMNGGTLVIQTTATEDPNQVLIGQGTTLSTFIQNGGTIMLDGPETGLGSTSFKGLREIDWEVGLNGMGRFEMHNDAQFFASDDLKVAENAAGSGSVLMDGNSYVALGSGVSISSGAGKEQIMIMAGNSRLDSGNSMGAGNPLGGTDEGYVTLAIGGGRGTLIVQDNAILNMRRLSAREGTSTFTVKNNGQVHIFDVLTGAGTNAASRPAELGPNSTFGSAATSFGTFTLQDDAVMTVNVDTPTTPTTGLGISAQRDAGNAGGDMKMIIRDRASLTIEQALMLGTGADAETSKGTLEIVGPDATVNIKGNLNMAVSIDGLITAVDDNGLEAPATSILSAVITGPTHTPVQVGGIARIGSGQLKVALRGYSPAPGTTYTLIDGGTIEGTFLGTDLSGAPLPRGLSWEVEYAADAVRLKVVAAPAGRVVTVTTADNANPPSGSVSLLQALTGLQASDTIRFNIPGAGPHFIETPAGGYPLITADNITIDGYSQPGSSPNTNPILAANNAQIRIVLDSRNGNVRVMDFDPDVASSGYGDTEAAVIGIYAATNFYISGFSILSVPILPGASPSGENVTAYGISLAKAASGYISGNWIGVAPDGTTLAAPANGITGFAWRLEGSDPRTLNTNVVVGVQAGSTNAPAEFNVFCGIPGIPIILESEGARISGNFINVFPSGIRDFNPPLADPENFFNTFGGNIEIGRANNNTLIGVNGDGINDSNERNVLSGVLPRGDLGGYDHSIEFYSQTPGTNIVIAGNYFGIGIDGTTRFTNGVPALNAAGGSAQIRFGSDFDGVSDELEGNVVYNNWPTEMFPTFGGEGFFDELDRGGIVSARGNVFVNNFPFPVSPLNAEGQFLIDYYAKALVDSFSGVMPIISPDSTAARLVGTVPVANEQYPVTIIDLYLADPEGIAYGLTAGVPEMTNGYVQGKTYLGSFVDNSPADANPVVGEFDFNISSLNPTGLLTITANYSQSPAGTHNAITLTSPFSNTEEVTGTVNNDVQLAVERTATGIRITWTGGTSPFTLQRKSSLSDPNWTTVTPSGERTADIPTDGAMGFFRIQH